MCTRLSLESLPSQRERVAVGKQPENTRTNGTFHNGHGFATTLLGNISPRSKKCPQTSVFGFSKGGVVLNQLLAELTHLEDQVEEGKVSIRKNLLHRCVSKPPKFEVSKNHLKTDQCVLKFVLATNLSGSIQCRNVRIIRFI